MSTTVEYSVKGMHCKGCELFIEKTLEKIEGVENAEAALQDQRVKIKVQNKSQIDEVIALANRDLQDTDYRIESREVENPSVQSEHTPAFGHPSQEGMSKTQSPKPQISYLKPLLIALVIVALFFLLQQFDFAKQLNAEQITYPFIFLVGIVASLSTCMAVVGGLVLSLSSSYSKTKDYKSIGVFHVSRLVSFFIFGGIIGLLGSTLQLTPTFTFIMNIILFGVMIILGLQILGVASKTHIFSLPKSLTKRFVARDSSADMLTAIFLGAITFILPCGFTQSMQFYTLTTGSFVTGALTMFVFALGTLPVLALMSFASVKFSQSMQSGIFFKVAGFLVLFFAIINLLSALASIGLIKPIISV